jgi:hypothetical protein
MAALQEEGLSPRTIFNHVMRIKTFLRSRGIVDLLKPEDIPDYDEPDVEAYDVKQLGALFAAADPGERLLFEFFLPTFRDQEVRYCTWRNVDFREESSASARTLNSDSARKIRRSAPYLSPTP